MAIAWRLTGRCFLVYTLFAGGVTNLLVYWFTQSAMMMLGVVLVGQLLLLFVYGGTASIRLGSMIQVEAPGSGPSPVDSPSLLRQPIRGEVPLFFYAIGMISWGILVLVMTGW